MEFKTTKIKFKQLSIWLKISVIMGWVFGAELFIVFWVAFFSALLGA